MTSQAAPVTQHEFTPDQIEEAIARAVEEREFDVIPGLVKLLAVQSPDRAQQALDALQGRYTVNLNPQEATQ